MSRVADPKAKIVLLRAAEEVFARRGLAGAKVEEITKRAGVSKGAFYLHFESKEAALKQVVETFLARCSSYCAGPAEYPELPEDADAVLDFVIERDTQIYEFLWQNRAILRILGTCQGQYDYLVEAFRSDIAQRTRAWIDYFRREGLFRAGVDPELAATIVGGAYDALTLKLVQTERRPPLEAWLAFAQETFVRAYGTNELVHALEQRQRRSGVNGEAALRHRSHEGRH